MDPSSLAPALQQQHGEHYYREVNRLREVLRDKLTTTYRLEGYDIFLVQSVRIGLAMLSHLLHKHNLSLQLGEQRHYQPIELLFSHPVPNDASAQNSGVNIVTHVNPYTGVIDDLEGCEGKAVVDASHSFATGLHDELITNSSIFLAPLHKHASVAVGLAIIAVRPEHYSCLFRSELRLFEGSTVSQRPLQEAIDTMDAPTWRPYNVASIEKIDLPLTNGLRLTSVSASGLPFACFPVATLSEEQLRKIKQMDGSYFEHAHTLRISRSTRGKCSQQVDHTGSVIDDLARLWSQK
ncbi:hypothetical protein AwEntero_18780 [Enterobacterales bacterium]|nr:hypothetical protein AwEntero_18780 [Enterobacterales bacterium]